MPSQLRSLLALLIFSVTLASALFVDHRIPKLYALAISILAGLGTFVGTGLDLVKKWYEISKLRSELREKQQQNKESERLILPATPQQVEALVSYQERKMAAAFKREIDKENLEINQYIEATHERRIRK